MKGHSSAMVEGQVISGGVRFELSTKLFPLEAVYQAAYVFIDDYYVYLDRPATGVVAVELRPKENVNEELLRKSEGEFRNELLAQVVRRQLAKQTERLRELIVARALYGALGPEAFARALGIDMQREEKSIEELEDEALRAEQEELDKLLAEIEADFVEDPLDIATPWEEKYGSNQNNKEANATEDKSDKDEEDKKD